MSSRSSRNIASRSLAATLIIIVTAAVAVSILKRGDLGTTTALLCSSSQPTAAAVDGAQQALLRDLNDAKKKAKTCAKELENVGEARAEAEERAARYQEEAAKASDLCPKATAGASTPDELARSIFQADAQVLESTLSTYEALLEGTWDRQLAAQPEEGILMVAGAKKYLINAFVSLWAVRRHWNSTLPVAIMYWGADPGDVINAETQAFFHQELGEPKVQFIDASKDLPWPAHHRAMLLPGQRNHHVGWRLKLAAAYLAPFQKVLFLDADSAPLVPPESLFRMSKFKASGALFWPDALCQRPDLFDDLIAMGLIEEGAAPGQRERETESGQWLLDRRRHRLALEYAMLLGTHAEYTFTRAFGDKDLFRAAFTLAGAAADYTLVPVGFGFAVSPPDASRNNARLVRGYIQHSHRGQPLFHHRAGWETKYDLGHMEGRPFDAISAPLPCAWTVPRWPLEYPGELDDSDLRLVEPSECAPLRDGGPSRWAAAVEECSDGFNGSPGQRVPIFAIKGSAVEEVHKAQEMGWDVLVRGRWRDPKLFENWIDDGNAFLG